MIETTVGRLSEWSDSVHALAKNIKAAVREAKRQGTTSISRDNLKQLTTTKGLTISPSAFERCFEQALELAELPKGFVYERFEDEIAALADDHEADCYEDEGEAAYGRE